ncbi:hypothetical protein FLT15_12025 [Paenibacillus thiaminolyticus]|uniref:hypothetical protein n=1 Tax=Paenibacillus thiaminolyticus TaxID=49283 RepID=UPI001162BE81|nr:hypothetical protein [Paenibacillus thiaminolyticus]NGP59058.1 hypothetical protein [Paenibacillus thiaminolyticus]
MINRFESIIKNDFTGFLNDREISEDTKSRYISDLEYYFNNCISSLTVFDEYKDYFNKFALKNYHERRKTATARYAISNLVEYFKVIDKLNATEYLNIKNELKKYQKIKQDVNDFLNRDDIDYLLAFQYKFGKKRSVEDKLVAPLIIALSYYALFEQTHISNLQIKHLDLLNSRIKNIRLLHDNFVQEWIPINDTMVELIKRYLEYRRQFGVLKDDDSMIVLNGQKPTNRSINDVLNIFNDTKGNTDRLSARVNLQKIIRTRILLDLIKTNGQSLINFYSVIGFNKDTQILSATKEYLVRVSSQMEYGIR